VDAVVAVLRQAAEEDAAAFYDGRRRCLELLPQGVSVPLAEAEQAALARHGYAPVSFRAQPSPRVRDLSTLAAHGCFDRSSCVRLQREHARALFARVDRRMLALHVLASLEALAGASRRPDCEAGWLACPVASSLTRLYGGGGRLQALVDVAELLRRHGSAARAWAAYAGGCSTAAST
jgi:hypothetical protein